MTEDLTPTDASDDELVSAYLDDEASAEERARVESDDRLLALVDTYRATAQAVGSPVLPLDQDRRDAMVAAALAVADQRDDGSTTDDADADTDSDSDSDSASRVVPIGRGRRSRWVSRAPGLAAAAAFLFLIGVGLVITAQGSDKDQRADTSADSSEESAVDRDGAAEDSAGGGESSSLQSDQESSTAAGGTPDAPLAAAPVSDLGEFADEDALRGALSAPDRFEGEDPAGDAEAEQRSKAALDSDTARCANVVTTTDTLLGELQAVRTASLAGRPVLIFTHVERDEPDRLIDTVTDQGSCQILFAQAR